MPARFLLLVLLTPLLSGCQSKSTPALVPSETKRANNPAPRAVDPATKESGDQLVRQGTRALELGDALTAVRSLERAVATEPNNRQALWLLAVLREQQAAGLPRPQSSPVHLQVAAIMRRLRSVYPGLTPQEQTLLRNALYNESCTLALDGEFARALGSLNEAIEAGFNDLAHIESDTELDNLRRLPDYRAILSRLEQRLIVGQIQATKPFPFDFRLSDLDGKPVKLSDFRGKVLVVTFWGTWNSPGRKLVSHLGKLFQRRHDQGLEVVGLAYENESGGQGLKGVRAFARETGIHFPCLAGDVGTRNLVADFEGYPTTLFIDRAGKIRLRLNGYQPLSSLEIAATALLEEKVATPSGARTGSGTSVTGTR